MRHDAELCDGPGYDYLGHFERRAFLTQGHNSGWMPGIEGEGLSPDPFAKTVGENDKPEMKAPPGTEDRNNIRSITQPRERSA